MWSACLSFFVLGTCKCNEIIILSNLVECPIESVQAYHGSDANQVVLTVPLHFGDKEKADMRYCANISHNSLALSHFHIIIFDYYPYTDVLNDYTQ